MFTNFATKVRTLAVSLCCFALANYATSQETESTDPEEIVASFLKGQLYLGRGSEERMARVKELGAKAHPYFLEYVRDANIVDHDRSKGTHPTLYIKAILSMLQESPDDIDSALEIVRTYLLRPDVLGRPYMPHGSAFLVLMKYGAVADQHFALDVLDTEPYRHGAAQLLGAVGNEEGLAALNAVLAGEAPGMSDVEIDNNLLLGDVRKATLDVRSRLLRKAIETEQDSAPKRRQENELRDIDTERTLWQLRWDSLHMNTRAKRADAQRKLDEFEADLESAPNMP